MSNATAAATDLHTAGYFDPTAGTFEIITPKNFTLKSVEIPQEILDSPRAKQETWVRTQIRKTGNKPNGKSHEYPYGFFYNL